MATRIRKRGAKLYDTDFVRWSEEQAAALRAVAALPADCPFSGDDVLADEWLP
jgi:hypothetical protein